MSSSALLSITNPLSMAELSSSFLSLPFLRFSSSKPTILRHPRLSSSCPPLAPSLSLSLSLSLKKRLPLLPLVAQTSDWAQQEEEEEEDDDELELDGPEATGLSEWEEEGDDEGAEAATGAVAVAAATAATAAAEYGVAEEEGGGEEAEEDGEESYPEPPEEAKLFVGNLPYDMDSENLAQLFDKAGVVEVAEVIYNRETDQSRGFGFVTMSTVEEAEKAVGLFHRYDSVVRLQGDLLDFKKNDLEAVYRMYYAAVDILPYSSLVNYHVPLQQTKEIYTKQIIHASRQAIDDFHGQEDLHVSSLQSAMSITDINGRLLTVNKAAPRGARVERTPRDSVTSLRIYVGNLPWQVDDARLEQVFSEHGKVVDARVVYDRETGRSRGFGFVTMATKNELDDAIAALDGQTLDGRALRVNIAEERPRRSF